MWTTIDRACRRVADALTSAQPARSGRHAAEPGTPAADPPRPVEDVVIVLGSHQVDQLGTALELALGDATERPDTPDRIEQALTLLLARRDALGRPHVLRRPAGLSSPESWEIHLDGVERVTSRAVRAAGRNGIFPA